MPTAPDTFSFEEAQPPDTFSFEEAQPEQRSKDLDASLSFFRQTHPKALQGPGVEQVNSLAPQETPQPQEKLPVPELRQQQPIQTPQTPQEFQRQATLGVGGEIPLPREITHELPVGERAPRNPLEVLQIATKMPVPKMSVETGTKIAHAINKLKAGESTPEQDVAAGKLIAGGAQALAGVVDFMTSPAGIATTLTGGVAGAAGEIGAAGLRAANFATQEGFKDASAALNAIKTGEGINKGLARAFALDMARNAPEQFSKIGDAIQKGDTETATRELLNAGLAAAVITHAAKGAIPETKPTTERTTDARPNSKAATLDVDVLSQSGEGKGQVPVKESGGGIQPQTEGGLPKEVTPESVSKMSPEEFNKFAGTNATGKAYEAANAMGIDADRSILKQGEAAAVSDLSKMMNELAQSTKDKKAAEVAGDTEAAKAADEKGTKIFNELQIVNAKKQYFNEAQRMLTAMDDVKKGMSVKESSVKNGVGERRLEEYSKPKEAPKSETPKPRGLQTKPTAAQLAEAGQSGSINLRALTNLRESLPTIWERNPNRRVMDQTLDAADNMAKIEGQQQGKSIKIGVSPIEDEAASAVVASGFDQTKLNDFLQKAIQGKNKKVENIVRYAMANWNKLQPIAQRGKAAFDNQLAAENARGIETERHEDYLPGVYDMDLLMGSSRPFVIAGSKLGGARTGFKKGKTYATPFDAVAEGYQPKSLKLSDLVESRIRAGHMLINRMDWGDSLRKVIDPTDSKPIVTSLTKKMRPSGTGYETAPMGYVPREIVPGMRVAVHEGYEKLFDALTGRTSGVRQFEVGGLPVGELAMEGVGGIKHGTLLLDTYHAARVLAKDFFLTGTKAGYKKGLSILEYSPQDLQRAVQAGEITQEQADFASTNQPKAKLLLQNGLNVGRIQQAMYTSLVRKIPVIGGFNKWVFDKLTRGAMLESGLIEFDRVKRNNPNLSDTEVARQVARDLNKFFGNLQRQGVFKSQTMLDLSALAGFAPQWVESQIRSEAGGFRQLAGGALKGKLSVGSLGTGMARGLAATVIATQLLNLMTKGKPTWENEENQNGGSKLDAWIPDLTGKTKGYRVSPLSIIAENTHDLMNAVNEEPDKLSAAARIASNKAGSAVRIGKVLLQGRDWNDKKIVGDWNKIKAAAIQAIPAPIAISSLVKGGPPGTAQRRIMQSFGVKTEPVKSARAEIANAAQKWGLASDDPKVKSHFEQRQKEEFPESQYKPLRTALIENKPEDIKKEVLDILNREPDDDAKEKKLRQILTLFNPFNKKEDIKPAVTGSKETESKFIGSLDDRGRKLYMDALKERAEDYRRLSMALFGKEVEE
jgi:hypothetical protein